MPPARNPEPVSEPAPAAHGQPDRSLLGHIVRFSRALGKAGIAVDTANLIDLCRCFSHLDISRKRDFYAAARTNLVSNHDDFARFDQVFDAFWQKTMDQPQSVKDSPDAADEDSIRKRAGERHRLTGQVDEEHPWGDRQSAHLEYSPDEILARRDLGEMDAAELERARRLMAGLLAVIAHHQSRRRIPAHHGTDLDFRRMLRRTALQGQDPGKLLYRRRRIRKTRLLLLCDVSGSMERYSRFLIQFICALRCELPEVEVAVFSTRLTVITPFLAGRDNREIPHRFRDRIPDWAGGTDIGQCIDAFNRHFASRMLATRSIVVILSDGWDRGDAERMASAIRTLRRNACRLIWLNPLLGREGYQPLCRGIKTALPYMDYFLPAHNLESLGQLVKLLRKIWK